MKPPLLRKAAFLLLLGLATGNAPRAAETPPTLPPAPATNLVLNGDFERAHPEFPGQPAGWERPDGLGVRWEAAPEDLASGQDRGKAMRLDTRISERDMVASWRKAALHQWVFPNPADAPIAGSYGLSYYSEPFPASTNRRYRVSFDIHAPGHGIKVWVRGYAPTRKGDLRRCYETVVHCRPESNRWQHEERIFHPAKSGADLREFRVMLYAYWPPGVYWFDNLCVEALPPEPPDRTAP